MDKIAKLRDALRSLSPTGSVLTTAKVLSIEGDTCTIDIDGLAVEGVRLRPTSSAATAKVLLTPSVGSFVLIGSMSGDLRDLAVLASDMYATIELTSGNITVKLDSEQGKITINGGLLGGLVKIRELENNINSVKEYAEAMNAALPVAFTAIGSGEAASGPAGADNYASAMAGRAIVINDMEDANITH